MTMRTALTLLLAGIAVLAAAGCGEDDERGLGRHRRTSSPGRSSTRVIGGDAFRDDKITVEADGSAQVRTRQATSVGKLTAAER